MANVLLLILLVISIVLTGLILIQRSEGGALGIGGGGGGGGGGFMSGRSAADSIVKMTALLGGLFLVCSLLLSIAFNRENTETSLLDETNAEAPLTFDDDSVEDTDPLASTSDEAATDTDMTVTVPETDPEEPAETQTPEDE